MKISRQRTYAFLVTTGAGILFYRTVAMVAEGYLGILTWWAGALLLAEMIIDLACIVTAIVWFRSGDPSRDRLPLRLGTVAALLHAVRVGVYVLGRTAPALNFDVRSSQVHHYGDTSWFWVWFAALLALLGVAGVVVIWRIRIRNRKRVL